MMEKNQNPGEEKYLHGYSPEHRAFLSSRTATREAAFFLPFLKPGMKLLPVRQVGPMSEGRARVLSLVSLFVRWKTLAA